MSLFSLSHFSLLSSVVHHLYSSPIFARRHQSLPLCRWSISDSPPLPTLPLRRQSVFNSVIYDYHSLTPIYDYLSLTLICLQFTDLWLSLSHTLGSNLGIFWWVCDLVLDGYDLWWAGGGGYLFDSFLWWTGGGWWWLGMSFMVWFWVWVWVCDLILGLFLFVILVVRGWGYGQWWLWQWVWAMGLREDIHGG